MNPQPHLAVLAALFVLLTSTLHAQVPQLLNYQGRVAVGAVNFEGAGLFRFALVDATGATTFWSNDGTSVAGSEPTGAVSLAVSKGLYSVLLGDAALLNMAAIPVTVFTNPDVRLRVWFDDGLNGSQLLTPDQRIAPTPYLADGTVSSASIAPGAVNSTSIAAGAVNGTHVAPGSLDFSRLTVPAAPGAGQVLGFNGATLNWVAPGAGDGIWALNGTNAFYNAGNIGIGTSNPAAKLDVRGSLVLEGGGSPGVFTGTGNVELNRYLLLLNSTTFASASGLKAGGTLVADSFSYANPNKNNLIVKGSVGIGTPTPATKLTVQTAAGSVFSAYGIEHTDGTVRLTTYIDGSSGQFGTRSNHPLSFFVNDGLPLMTIDGNGTAMVSGLGTFTVGSPNGESGSSIKRGGNRGDVRFDGATLKLVAGPGVGPPSSFSGIAVTTAGNVGIGTTGPAAKLDVRGSGITEATVSSVDERAILSLNSTIGGSNRVWTLENGVFGNAGQFAIYDRNAGRARLTITTAGVVGVDALQIRGGADLAEHFDVKAARARGDESAIGVAEPGMVACIDPENPGKLIVSCQAYDRRVAGIISGAGGVRPGMVMSQEGSVADGKHPVALTGRVYCLVDASYGSVAPGDLLTTSDTPGHAMKVTDHAKAQGAIIGKAMSALDEGTGMVLVLVTLQ